HFRSRQRLCGLTVTILLLCKGCHSQVLGCGLALSNTKIVGGNNASPGSWPWQVSLVAENKHFCAGTLINNQWVLTASHCISGSERDTATVYLGRFSQSGLNPSEVSRRVAQIECHPAYDYLTDEHDICLLKLSAPVNFTLFIQPVCLPTADSTFHAGLSSWVAGWGRTATNQSSDILQEVNLPIVGNKQCQCDISFLITENMICAGVKAGGKDACQGDSGGALVNKKLGRWVQNGIVSFGDGCARPNSPGGFTRVSQYQQWIETITGVNKTEFVTFTSAGPDSDANFTCATSPPITTKQPLTTEGDKCGDSVFCGGENLMHFTHFVSLALLVLSLHVLVAGA
uniref:Peptidase S1 domain-containing protein n=1 Tax=Scophthalmus maximus TaxID=52904 RepID=A0A8D2ZN27_SCOMX